MTDVANGAPSDGAASETVQPNAPITSTPSTPVVESAKPAVSSREALERAFQSVTEPPKTAAERARDEAGRFAKAEDAKPDAKPAEAAKPAAAPVVAKPEGQIEVKPAAKPAIAAPAGFTKAAAEAWAQTPEPVRADVERRITELTQGIEGYKATVEPIRKYVDMAKQHGTTLDAALENYTGMEDLLSRDFVGGVRLLCQNLGFHPAQLVAALTGQQVNGQHGQPSPEVAQLRQYNQSLEQKIAKLEEQFGGFTSTFESTRAADMINRFASDPAHKYFDELRPSISEMLATGYAKDLSDAYEKAVRLNPEVFAKVEADKAAKAAPTLQPATPSPDQTRTKAALSVTGSPPVGSTPNSRKPAGSAREALQNAMAQTGL